MDKRKIQELKDAKQKITEGSLTLWNARLDALIAGGYSGELINHITAVDICGCGGGSPICGCDCPAPFTSCSSQPSWDHGINEINQALVVLTKEVKALKEKNAL